MTNNINDNSTVGKYINQFGIMGIDWSYPINQVQYMTPNYTVLTDTISNEIENCRLKFENLKVKEELALISSEHEALKNKIKTERGQDLISHLWHKYFWPATIAGEAITLLKVSPNDYENIHLGAPENLIEELAIHSRIWGVKVEIDTDLKDGAINIYKKV